METIFKAKLMTVKDVKEFSQIATNFPRNVGVAVSHEGYKVDGKSLLGLLSLNLSEPVTVTISDSYELEDKIKEFDKWVVR